MDIRLSCLFILRRHIMTLVTRYFSFTSSHKGVSMKIAMAFLASAFMMVSVPAFAGAHGGGKMDDKKVDCSKKENEKNAACVKK